MATMKMPQTVIELLQAMVRIDSVNTAFSGRVDAEDRLASRLAQIADAWGLSTRRLPTPGHADQLLVMLEVDADRPWWLFDSHLDTVSIEGMTVDPLGAVIDGDRLIGRGACDTKGTGAAMLWALRRYSQSSDRPNNIAMLFSVDEEVSMAGVQSFVDRDLESLGIRERLIGAIVGEPTEFRPVVAHNGAIRWRITTHGKAAHSSTPHQGRSAISMMMRVVDAIESTYIPSLAAEHELTGRAQCSINTIRGGAAHNIIPARCDIEIDRRLVPGEDGDAVLPAVEALLAPLNLDHSQQLLVRYPPLNNRGNTGLAAAVQGVLERMALPTTAVGAPFCTNAGALTEAGVPVIVLGPGSPHPAHTRDEWVSISAIRQGVELYERIMRCTV